VDSELEVIRDEMEETRANLATKLEALETQVRETVSGASEAVSSTVEGVKDVVSNVTETVESVTETLNISKQVEEHPWVAVGIALGVGFLASQLFGGSSREPAPQSRHEPAPAPPPQPQAQPPLHLQPVSQPQPQPQPAAHSESSSGGVLSSLEAMMPDMNSVLSTAVTGLSSLAVGTLMGVVREVAVNGLPPEWKGELTNMIDKVTTQLGGKTLKAEPRQDDHPHQSQPAEQERLARLEDLPSPLPPHQENATEPQNGGEAGQKSRRGGKPVGRKV
jgi:ElaB/YqjD/DUF883 family membrane-anchored ribosome-binding protein